MRWVVVVSSTTIRTHVSFLPISVFLKVQVSKTIQKLLKNKNMMKLTSLHLIVKLMSLFFQMLSILITAVLPRSFLCPLISGLQPPFRLILEPRQLKFFMASSWLLILAVTCTFSAVAIVFVFLALNMEQKCPY